MDVTIARSRGFCLPALLLWVAQYLPRNDFNAAKLQEKIAEVETQLQTYAHDERIQKVAQQVTQKHLVLVYHGRELVYREEYSFNHEGTSGA